MKTLAEHLGVIDPRPEEKRDTRDFDDLVNVEDPKEFCKRIIQTREWRQYVMNGIVLGDLPPAVMTRILDHAWGKPAERVEHTGKDGDPIISEVRRVIIRVDPRSDVHDEFIEALPSKPH